MATVEAALEDRLRLEPYVLSTPQELATALRASTSDFQATTSLIAAIALFAGAFLVFNTLSMTVVEQVREVGLLRAAGATRRQVIRFMLSQAAAIGVLGSLVGVGLGALLAAAMVAYVRTIGSVTLQRPAIPVDGIAIAFLVGLGVTIAAALEPARRAGPDPAGRGAQGEARPARGAPGAACDGWRPSSCWSPSLACWSRRVAPASSSRWRSTRSCSSPRC